MKLLNVLFGLMLMSSVSIYADVSLTKKVEKKTILKINQWKKRLTKEQMLFLTPLLEQYDQEYKDYKHSKKQTTQFIDVIKAIEHVVDHWDSFYKHNIAAQIFHNKFQGWKTLHPEKALDLNVQSYQKAYDTYDKNPTRDHFEQLSKEQQALSIKNKM